MLKDVLVLQGTWASLNKEHAHDCEQAPDILIALRTNPVVFLFRTGPCPLLLLRAWQQCSKPGNVPHLSYVGLIRHIEANEDCQKTQTVLHNDTTLREPSIRVYHVENLGEGIFEDKQLLQLERGSRQVCQHDKTFVAHRVSGVV